MRVTEVTATAVGETLAAEGDVYDVEMEVRLYTQADMAGLMAEHNRDAGAHPLLLEGLKALEESMPVLPDHIVIDEHYNHTDNNFSDGEKEKLAGLAAGGSLGTEVVDASALEWPSNNNWETYAYGGSLTRIELRRTGNVVHLSGAIKCDNDQASTSQIFIVPERFRPGRTVSWPQMGQQWFNGGVGNIRAVSYFCQVDTSGNFSIDKMNIGGNAVQYQAGKYLFINGIWVVD